MQITNHRKKLFLEMGAIILIALAAGLIQNRRMLLDKWHGSVSSSSSSTAFSSTLNQDVIPAGLAQVRELFEKKQAVFVDAREASAYAASHIKDAFSLPVGESDKRLPEFGKKHTFSATLVVYCSGYGCRDSKLLANKLLKIGYKEVLVFEGGLPEWKDAGLPVEGTNK